MLEPVCFTHTQAQPRECAGELLSRLRDCASAACLGRLCHAIPVEWGEAGGEGERQDTARYLAGPSCLAPSSRGWHDAHFADGELMDSVATHMSCTGRKGYLYHVLSHLA